MTTIVSCSNKECFEAVLVNIIDMKKDMEVYPISRIILIPGADLRDVEIFLVKRQINMNNVRITARSSKICRVER